MFFSVSVSNSEEVCGVERTPSDAIGPFYVPNAPLTQRLAPEEQLADPAIRLLVQGRVYGNNCKPVADALVEPWYAGLSDENGDGGGYSSARSNLLYRAQVLTDACGYYSFTSTFPEIYSGRPIAHIHFRVSTEKEGVLLNTQMYFEGHILDTFNTQGRETQVVQVEEDEDGARLVSFDIVVDAEGNVDSDEDCLASTLPPIDAPGSMDEKSPTSTPRLPPLGTEMPSGAQITSASLRHVTNGVATLFMGILLLHIMPSF